MMRVPYLWLFVTALCNARVSVDVSYLPIVPRGFFSAVVAALSYCSCCSCACKFELAIIFTLRSLPVFVSLDFSSPGSNTVGGR